MAHNRVLWEKRSAADTRLRNSVTVLQMSESYSLLVDTYLTFRAWNLIVWRTAPNLDRICTDKGIPSKCPLGDCQGADVANHEYEALIPFSFP